MKRGTVRGVCLLAVLATLAASLGCTARDEGEGGSLMVIIKPAAEAGWLMEYEVLVQLSPGGAVAAWTPDSPAVFTGLKPGQRYQVHLPPRLLAEPRQVTALPDRPVKVLVGALTFSSLADLLIRSEHQHLEKALYVDTTVDPERWRLEWREGYRTVTRRLVPPSPEALTKVLAEEWKVHGNHQDPNDRHFDAAVVVVKEGAEIAEVTPLVGAFAPVRRVVRVRPERRSYRANLREQSRPVFTVRLAHPHYLVPPPSPPPPPSGGEPVAGRDAL